MPPPPIRMPCEGSDAQANGWPPAFGLCPMCGHSVTCRSDGTVVRHDRADILAMIDRGDYGEAT